MTVIALTPQPGTASVLIQISGAPAGPLTLTRSDEYGVVPVRMTEGQLPIAGLLTVVDAEACLTGSVTYSATDSSGTVTASTTLAGVSRLARLASVQLPAFAAAPDQIIDYRADQTPATSIHQPIGRPDPIAVLAPALTRQGTLTALCTDAAALADLQQLAAAGHIIRYRQTLHGSLDMYLVVTAITPRPEDLADDGWLWALDIGYREVRSPVLPLLGSAGWTYADVAATYSTYVALSLAFDSYVELVTGLP